MMASDVIDFPEPDSPTNPRTSPGSMEKDRLRTAAIDEFDDAFDVDGCCSADVFDRPLRGWGNSMVRSRTSSSGRTRSMVSALTSWVAILAAPFLPYGNRRPAGRSVPLNVRAIPKPCQRPAFAGWQMGRR